jgi:tetratricopeptide (TPR) repeat protein
MDGGGNVAGERSAASTHPLAYVRRRHGWSYQDLAKVIAEHARALGVPMAARREKVWRWEHWGVVPEADSQRALARALGVPARELELRPWPRWLPAHGGMPDGLPWTPDGSLTALAALVDDGTDDPRGYPIADEGALRDAIADWDAARAEGAAVPAGGAGKAGAAPEGTGGPSVPGSGQRPGGAARHWADGGVVEWLEAGVLGLRRLDDRLGGAAVRHRVEADLRLVSGLLRRDPGERAARGRLLRAAADLAQLGGWAATDTGRLGAAQRHYLTGLRLAHTAGDRAMAVALWGGLALQEVIAGRPQAAVAAAEAAVRAAGNTAPAVRALAASRLGRAHAALGAEAAFRRAAAEAERQLEAAGADPGPPWLYWFDAAELAAQNGLCLLDLGAAPEAGPLLERALAQQDPAFLRDRSLYAARAAEARALTGDLEGARSLGREAAALSRHCGSPRLAAALDSLKRVLDARP